MGSDEAFDIVEVRFKSPELQPLDEIKRFTEGLLDRLCGSVPSQVIADWRKAFEAMLHDARTVSADSAPGSFMWALRSGRPVRRGAMINHAPNDLDTQEGKNIQALVEATWLYPSVMRLSGEHPASSVWINLANGSRVALGKMDYIATDWEIMP